MLRFISSNICLIVDVFPQNGRAQSQKRIIKDNHCSSFNCFATCRLPFHKFQKSVWEFISVWNRWLSKWWMGTRTSFENERKFFERCSSCPSHLNGKSKIWDKDWFQWNGACREKRGWLGVRMLMVSYNIKILMCDLDVGIFRAVYRREERLYKILVWIW